MATNIFEAFIYICKYATLLFRKTLMKVWKNNKTAVKAFVSKNVPVVPNILSSYHSSMETRKGLPIS